MRAVGTGAWQAFNNPTLDDNVYANWSGNLYPGLIGASFAVAYMPMCAHPFFNMLPKNEAGCMFMYMKSFRGFSLSVLAGIPVYALVKGFSFCDFGTLSLRPFERYLNGLTNLNEKEAVEQARQSKR